MRVEQFLSGGFGSQFNKLNIQISCDKINKSKIMDKKEAALFKKRWDIVNKYEREELRRTPLKKKFRQLAVLMASFELFQSKNFPEEDEASRERWNLLKRRICG